MNASSLSLPILAREAIDNSIGSTINRCPRLAFYNYALNRSPVKRDYPISFGSAYHVFREELEKLYRADSSKLDELRRLTLFESAFAIATKGWEDPPVEHKKSYLDKTRLRETCLAVFEDSWVPEKENGYYKVISTEAPFQLELPEVWRCSQWTKCDYKWRTIHDHSGRACPKCGAPLERRRFLGRIDQVIEWNGRLWMRDFKTTGRKVDFNKKYNPDHQFTGYTWAAQKLSGRAVDGAIIDIAYNTKTKGPEFYPTIASRSSGDIEHWLEWIHDTFDEWEARIRSGIWPMNTMACDMYGECTFRRACASGSWVAIEEELKAHTVHSVWDPLNPDDEEGLPEG